MTEWIDINTRMPKEGEFPWVQIKKDDKEYDHGCKVWEREDGAISFVNIMFEKELDVTHWRPKAAAPSQKEES